MRIMKMNAEFPGDSLVRDGDFLYLAGRRVKPGDEIDVIMATGAWVTIIVTRTDPHMLAVLWLILGGPIELLLAVPSPARFRWTPRPSMRRSAGRRVST